jgi:hypothetical protein
MAVSTDAPIDDPNQLKDTSLRRTFTLWSEASASGNPPSKDFVAPDRLGDLRGWLLLDMIERDTLPSSISSAGRRLFAVSDAAGRDHRMPLVGTNGHIDHALTIQIVDKPSGFGP